MTRAINPTEKVQEYTHAAWCFATSVLWSRLGHDDEISRSALGDLELYFRSAKNPEKAFAAFCERVVMAEALCHHIPMFDARKVWMALMHPDGLLALGEPVRERLIARIRRKYRIRAMAIPIVAKHFFEYVRNPSPARIQGLYDELVERLESTIGMKVFYQGIQRCGVA